jgi:hypothetical protein
MASEPVFDVAETRRYLAQVRARHASAPHSTGPCWVYASLGEHDVPRLVEHLERLIDKVDALDDK